MFAFYYYWYPLLHLLILINVGLNLDILRLQPSDKPRDFFLPLRTHGLYYKQRSGTPLTTSEQSVLLGENFIYIRSFLVFRCWELAATTHNDTVCRTKRINNNGNQTGKLHTSCEKIH